MLKGFYEWLAFFLRRELVFLLWFLFGREAGFFGWRGANGKGRILNFEVVFWQEVVDIKLSF